MIEQVMQTTSIKPRALLILGPTASGKTALAIALGQYLQQLPAPKTIEVISVDSALVYRGMDIGSAKPTLEERAGIVHHLIDVCDIDQPYSAADFVQDCERLITEITARGHFPVIVGGTMLYAKALRESMDELPTTDPETRAKVLAKAEQIGWSAMHEQLAEIDPVTAARLSPNDSQRIGRAIEVYEMTGKPISEFHAGPKTPDPTLPVLALLPEDRKRLHQAIGERFDAMITAGFIDEMHHLMQQPNFSRDLPSMRAVGYRQAIAYLSGDVDLATFIEQGKAATRQLAKRQITWLRSMPEIVRVDPYQESRASLVALAVSMMDGQDCVMPES